MSDSSRFGNFGAKHTFTYNGKEYALSFIDQPMKLAYAKKLYSNARTALQAEKDHFEFDEYNELMERLQDAYTNKEFQLNGKRGARTLRTPYGLSVMLGLMANVSHDMAMDMLETLGKDIGDLMSLVIKESFPNVNFEEGEAKKVSEPFEVPDAILEYRIAQMIDVYHVSLEQIAKLTDYQIHHLYFHKRDKEGALVAPELPRDVSNMSEHEQALMALETLKNAMPPENYEEAKAKLLNKINGRE